MHGLPPLSPDTNEDVYGKTVATMQKIDKTDKIVDGCTLRLKETHIYGKSKFRLIGQCPTVQVMGE